ncbi:MAG: cation diffusion facilitator family transporter [Alphaproteobacteria bacterium]|nr:cation diffusion facilitator family transporter [Alphaproteobacteria bacterium]
MRRATMASVSVAVVLTAVKLAAWLATGSVAMLSSLVDSVLDAFASMTTMWALAHALTPADHEHRFGHGKAEPLASVGQAAFIAGSASFVLIEAVRRLWQPTPITATTLGIGVMVLAIAATLALLVYQHHVVRLTGSLAISGDSLHYAGDLLTNLAVILSLVLGGIFGFTLADPLLGTAIAVYLLYGSWTLARRALAMLMDEELPEAERARLSAIILAQSEVKAIHDLRTRASGPHRFIQFHLELDGALSLIAAHAVADRVEAAVRKEFPESEVIIHQDPAGVEAALGATPERVVAGD